MMETVTGATLAEYSMWAVTGLVGAAFGIQKLVKTWKSNSTETSIISLMHKELQRLAETNHVLQTELGRLQIELIRLNTSLSALTSENQRLHQEIATLTTSLNTLHVAMAPINPSNPDPWR